MKKFFALIIALGLASSQGLAEEKKEKKAGSVRVYRFDNLDIEGHVKTPHLMYFLKRIKNRFRSFRLPKRNLKKKIIETKHADFL